MNFEQHSFFEESLVSAEEALVSRPQLKIRIEGKELTTTPVFFAYWTFAERRQRIFFKRVVGANDLQSVEDPILSRYRFTNAYRASDRVSQFLIQNVIWQEYTQWSREDTFFRILLFKLFNKIETWQALENELGTMSWSTYDFSELNAVLNDRQAMGARNYSAAYIMPSAGSQFGHKAKHSNHLRLLEWMMEEQYPQRLTECRSMGEAYDLMLAAHSIGPFLAYQLVTDLNYSLLTSFSEMEFVKAGPGALDGISKCFHSTEGVAPEAIIRHMALNQAEYFEQLEIDFPSLWGRPLQLIDCQNLFCEISKYSRVAFPDIEGISGRLKIKQKYAPAGRLSKPFYPPDWGINHLI